MNAESAPATPMMKFPMTKAAIFQRATSIPKLAAAISSRRTVSRATPIHERSRRWTTAKASPSSTSAIATYFR